MSLQCIRLNFFWQTRPFVSETAEICPICIINKFILFFFSFQMLVCFITYLVYISICVPFLLHFDGFKCFLCVNYAVTLPNFFFSFLNEERKKTKSRTDFFFYRMLKLFSLMLFHIFVFVSKMFLSTNRPTVLGSKIEWKKDFLKNITRKKNKTEEKRKKNVVTNDDGKKLLN